MILFDDYQYALFNEARISLPVDVRVMSEESPKHDHLWVTWVESYRNMITCGLPTILFQRPYTFFTLRDLAPEALESM